MGKPTMTEELEQLLKNLKLKRILEIYDEQLRAADKDDISYSELVTRLVRAQFQARQEGALALLPHRARRRSAVARTAGQRTRGWTPASARKNMFARCWRRTARRR